MKKFNILFLCTGNSARSIMAEAAASDPRWGQGKLRGYSAGSMPTGQPHPAALATLARHNVDAGTPSSKSWDVFTADGAPTIDFMITVCDNAAGEVCPVWPGQPTTAHWGIPDPAAVTEPGPAQDAAFESAFEILSGRIATFASLPLHDMDATAVRQAAAEIARA
ncbi:arsenate reductase ArsC [bacterium]|nr:arsenate reductase ArsC [bacterium]